MFSSIGDAGFAERARATRARYLEGTLRECEKELKGLGKTPEAWRALEVTWNSTPRPIFGVGPEARELLGQEYTVMRDRKRPRRKIRGEIDLPAYRAIQKLARQIAEAEGVEQHRATSLAIQRNPALYERYRKQRLRTLPGVKMKEAWRHAETAAVMAAALRRLDDPGVMFAAGVAEAEYHQYNHQRKLLNKAERERHRQLEDAARRVRQKAGEKKSGKRMPQTVLIHATVKLLTDAARPSSWTEVLAVLTGEHPEADELLESLKDVVNPIELQDDDPPVDVEDEGLFFRFKNRPDRRMTLARFRNAVSDAARTRS
jgi:hypothetical protein